MLTWYCMWYVCVCCCMPHPCRQRCATHAAPKVQPRRHCCSRQAGPRACPRRQKWLAGQQAACQAALTPGPSSRPRRLPRDPAPHPALGWAGQVPRAIKNEGCKWRQAGRQAGGRANGNNTAMPIKQQPRRSSAPGAGCTAIFHIAQLPCCASMSVCTAVPNKPHCALIYWALLYTAAQQH